MAFSPHSALACCGLQQLDELCGAFSVLVTTRTVMLAKKVFIGRAEGPSERLCCCRGDAIDSFFFPPLFPVARGNGAEQPGQFVTEHPCSLPRFSATLAL